MFTAAAALTPASLMQDVDVFGSARLPLYLAPY